MKTLNATALVVF